MHVPCLESPGRAKKLHSDAPLECQCQSVDSVPVQWIQHIAHQGTHLVRLAQSISGSSNIQWPLEIMLKPYCRTLLGGSHQPGTSTECEQPDEVVIWFRTWQLHKFIPSTETEVWLSCFNIPINLYYPIWRSRNICTVTQFFLGILCLCAFGQYIRFVQCM